MGALAKILRRCGTAWSLCLLVSGSSSCLLCCWPTHLLVYTCCASTHVYSLRCLTLCPLCLAARSGPFSPAGHTYTETIYLLGNPMVIWMVLGGLVGVVALLLLYARYRTDRLMALPARTTRFVTAAIFCFLAYWLNLLPYLLVRRSSFIYHYSEYPRRLVDV